jgi:aldehyde:ferredoxin oxidoreductase
MSGGYMRKVLVVDLSSGSYEKMEISEGVFRDFLGGYGLGAWFIYREQPRNIDPLGEEAILGIMPGLLTGTSVPFSGRFMVVGKSPLTGGWGDANAGGHLSPEIKRCGYDGIFFKGISERPVYVLVKGEEVEIRDASHLWGMDTVETEEMIQQEVGEKKIRVACIGRAGEKMSFISGVVTEGGRIAARSGLGAVMGSKNLKALAIKGDLEVAVADNSKLKELNSRFLEDFNRPSFIGRTATKHVRAAGRLLRILPADPRPESSAQKDLFCTYGTSGWTAAAAGVGDSPVRNLGGVGYTDFPLDEKAERISDDEIIKYQVKKYHCYKCPMGCGGICEVEEGPYPLQHTHKPEYETLAALGTNCLCSDLPSLMYMNDLLNRAGMDTISAGVTLSFAMECFEQGVLTRDDTDGLELTWGNPEAMVAMLEKMISREGFGDVLADGVKEASGRIGKGSEEFAMHAGGQELPMHDARYDPTFGLAYVTEPTPGRHTISSKYYTASYELDRKVKEVKKIPILARKKRRYKWEGWGKDQTVCSKYAQLIACTGMCMFGVATCDAPLVEWMNAVTGWDYDLDGYLKTGERIETIRQCFNAREGIKPDMVDLPPRAKGQPPLEDGPLAGVTVDMDNMRREYWEAMEYDPENGWPSEEKLRRLGIVWCFPGKGERMQFFR